MQKTLTIIFTFTYVLIFSQIKFEKGYIINNNNEKTEVLIKNLDWLENPSELTYKISENSPELKGTTSNIKEFQVYGYKKFVGYKGKIDFSSNNLQNLSYNKEPEWNEVEVFLYELSNGKKNLYSYYGKTNLKFLYSEDNGYILPLVYKVYYPEESTNSIAYNETYKNQLKKIFQENPEVVKSINNIEYSEYSLVKTFNKYNGITDEKNQNSKKIKKGKFNLYVKPGLNFMKLNVTAPNSFENLNSQFNSTQFRASLELEYVLPFNKNKWSIFFEPNYNSMKGNTKSANGIHDVTMELSFINFPFGIRHYMFLNNDSKFFINAEFPLFSIMSKDGFVKYSSTYFENNLVLSRISSNFSLGIGYNYKNKFSILASNSFKRSVSNYISWGVNLNYTTLSIAYNIF